MHWVEYTHIEAGATIFERFRCHHLKLLDGGLLEHGIQCIADDVR